MSHALFFWQPPIRADIKQLGPRRSASLPVNVGKVQSRGQCHCVRLNPKNDISWETNPASRYIVDAADKKALPIAREELHALLDKPVLDGIPLLVLGNKSDLPDKLSVDELIEALNLKAVSHREVSCYGISAKEETNLDAVLQWLIKRASK